MLFGSLGLWFESRFGFGFGFESESETEIGYETETESEIGYGSGYEIVSDSENESGIEIRPWIQTETEHGIETDTGTEIAIEILLELGYSCSLSFVFISLRDSQVSQLPLEKLAHKLVTCLKNRKLTFILNVH